MTPINEYNSPLKVVYPKIARLLCFVLFTLTTLSSIAQNDTTQKIIPNRINSIEQQQKPYVILISIDGFRWDLADKYDAKHLKKLRASGVQADYLKPSFPSLTFPNHYTIATGMYPAHHGIVDNIFYDKMRSVIYRKSDKKMAVDSSWYAGKPLWVIAEQQKMLSAVFYWPGSEISIDGIRPTYYYNYNEVIPIDRRVAIVKDWLQLPSEKRPHFIALYFPQVDKAAHNFKPESNETKAAVQLVDEAIGKLVAAAKSTGLAINFIVVSDHGMTTIDRENTISLPRAIASEKFIVPPGNAILHVYAKEKMAVRPAFKALKAEAKDYDVYKLKDIPRSWHYNKKEDWHSRVGDLILVPHLPNVFNINNAKPDLGQHGFDPAIEDMHATFYACGPQFKEGLKIRAFENVHIYPLIAKLLGLTYSQKIDGKVKILSSILN